MLKTDVSLVNSIILDLVLLLNAGDKPWMNYLGQQSIECLLRFWVRYMRENEVTIFHLTLIPIFSDNNLARVSITEKNRKAREKEKFVGVRYHLMKT